ncbi:MAG: T9SS type A sorting domain-containing protein [Ignavibacteriae bacterium]|nr:T9SS type A sorting domain-containing protein [Ignavibacteriota bacterium]MCB9215702.1 T9SS type A sorting domain-containing protein [Ignavibacteria bacterium]
MIQKPFCRCWILLVLMLLGSTMLSAQESSSYDPFNDPAIMHIGHLNPDCVPDTLYGLLHRNLQWMPAYICWGKSYDSVGTSLCDEGRYDSTVRFADVVDTTWIEAPNWGRYSCAVSIDKYNVNDTLNDLIFWIKGIDTVTGQQGARIPHDTARALVVFGQSKLETKGKIELDKIRNFQTGPFNAMALGVNTELVNPKKRDNTRKTSWELKRVNRAVGEEEDTTGSTIALLDAAVDGVQGSGEGILATGETGEAFAARVWPNPTIYTTHLEVAPLPAGTYTVEVLGVNGAAVWHAEIWLEQEGEVFETVDVSHLPSGHYILRIYTPVRSFGTYPVIVVK